MWKVSKAIFFVYFKANVSGGLVNGFTVDASDEPLHEFKVDLGDEPMSEAENKEWEISLHPDVQPEVFLSYLVFNVHTYFYFQLVFEKNVFSPM